MRAEKIVATVFPVHRLYIVKIFCERVNALILITILAPQEANHGISYLWSREKLLGYPRVELVSCIFGGRDYLCREAARKENNWNSRRRWNVNTVAVLLTYR